MKKTNKNKNVLLIGLLTIAVITIFLINKKAPDQQAGETKQQIEVTNQQTELKANGGGLKILKSELTDQAKFYPYEVNGTLIEVLAFKASDDTIRTAFNTCQVCNNSGRGYYVQEGDILICQNCGNQFDADQVELIKGGCNPVPITRENKIEDETTIKISEETLAQNVELFKNWKKQ